MGELIDLLTAFLGRLAILHRPYKRAIVFGIDCVLAVLSIWISYSLRVGVWIYWDPAVRTVALGAFALMIPCFVFAGVYRSIFRYAGTGLMRIILRAFTPYTIGMALIYMGWGFKGVPRTLGLLQPITFFLLVAGSRVLFRFLMIDFLGRGRFAGDVRRVLVYGAGGAGQQLASSFRSDPSIRLIGYVDDDKRLAGQKLDGDRVYWSGELATVAERNSATDILLALPNASRKRRREIVQKLKALKLNVKTLPQTADIVGGRVSISDFKPLEIEDLLGREPVAPNEVLLGRTIVGKTVLVTGAGGSIGGELCRQIIQIGAKRLILFEANEFALYTIDQTLCSLRKELGRSCEVFPILGSVTDRGRVSEIFGEFRPHTVFHAAAYKHVPLVEDNPVEGLRNNLLGTLEAITASRDCEAADFILISTDKAVRPTSIMGASKRAAEQVVQSFSAANVGLRGSMVRFGNVLGSTGSVVPLFRRQIEAGGPITLTDKRVTRYFMTIPEASNLVIQASGMAKGGEVFLLDMGKPISIADLARTMVQLSGLSVRDDQNPDGDIEIVEIGLRPGEKLYEELLINDKPLRTRHPRIMMSHENFLTWGELLPLIDELRDCRDPRHALEVLRKIVPEFDHARDNEASKLDIRGPSKYS
jgi:FlaA1/EpsC-like NDP-sugar epimerase